MAQKNNQGKGAGNKLPPEDRELWENVTDSIEPLGEQDRLRQSGIGPEQPSEAPPPPKTRKKPQVAPDNSRRKQSPKPPPSIIPGDIDRRARRKIAKGQVAIDSTLDLHGLTQDQAFSRLQRHIEEASHTGQRCILVITGKGGGDAAGEGSGKGILRRNLPDWLANQALSGLVSAISPAGRAHGGSGAFYVRLKRQK